MVISKEGFSLLTISFIVTANIDKININGDFYLEKALKIVAKNSAHCSASFNLLFHIKSFYGFYAIQGHNKRLKLDPTCSADSAKKSAGPLEALFEHYFCLFMPNHRDEIS